MLSNKDLSRLKNQAAGINNRLSKLFDALGDTNRFKIFILLLEGKGNICVTEFSEIFNISVPAASQQLKSLELAGLIERVRNGQMTCYNVCVNDPDVRSIIKTLKTSTSLT